jgi:translation initiation factor IF-3
VPEVRLVGEDGKQIGVIKTAEALAYAQERDLDLVEVAPEARPPVCRALDYSKYKYEQAQKLKAARKHQQQITIREIKFRPKIAQNDYDTKKGHVRRFLIGRDRVKVTIMFRGREVTHPDRGTSLLKRLAEELSDVGVVEQTPLQDGRNMTMMLAPSKAVLAGEKDPTKPGDEPEATVDAPAAQVRADGAAAPAPEATVDAPAAPTPAATADPPLAPAATADPPLAPAATADAPATADDAPATHAAEAESTNGVGDGPHSRVADTASPTPSDAAA